MRKNLIIVVSLLLGLSASAQRVTPSNLKSARNAVYEWIGNYNVYARCEGRSAKSNFYSLFASEDSLIFNDYLPMKGYDFGNPNISVADYVSLLRNKEGFYQMKYEIRNGKIESEKYQRGKLIFEISMEKTVWFYQRGNVEDDRYEYPKRKFKLNAVLEYSLSSDEITATSLTCADRLERFVVFHEGNVNEYVKQRDVDEKSVYLSNQFVKYHSVPIEEDEKMMILKNDSIKNYFGLGYTVGGEYINAPISDNRFSQYSIEGGIQHSVWLSYYRQLYLENANRMGLEISFMYKNSFGLARCDFNETYAHTDPDGSPYERIINVRNYQEQISRNILELPVTAKYEYIINKQFTVFAQAGLSLGFDLIPRSIAEGDTKYSGYYDWLFNVTLEQNGIYDFGEFTLRGNTDALGLNRYFVGDLFSIGACYYFMDDWMMEASFRYRGTVWGGVKQDESYHLSKTDGDWSSLTCIQDKFHTNAFNFQLQINYYF